MVVWRKRVLASACTTMDAMATQKVSVNIHLYSQYNLHSEYACALYCEINFFFLRFFEKHGMNRVLDPSFKTTLWNKGVQIWTFIVY